MKNKQTAYAKINPVLRVCSKRPDGYHELAMIMESVSIHDDLETYVTDEPGLRLFCRTEGDHLSSGGMLSTGDDNLVIRAANAIFDHVKDPAMPDSGRTRPGLNHLSDTAMAVMSGRAGLNLLLTKRIPMAAGLAGGSTDAAAALRGINELLELKLSTDELCSIGVRIGADVPYCIRGGSCLAEGIGEKLTPIAPPPAAHLLILKPQVNVPTANVYGLYDRRAAGSSLPYEAPESRMMRALDAGDLTEMGQALYNDLRIVTAMDYQIIPALERMLPDLGASGAMMSGSGPSVFGLFESKDECLSALSHIRGLYPEMYAEYAEFVI